MSVSQGWRQALLRFVILLRALTANSWTPSTSGTLHQAVSVVWVATQTFQVFASTSAHVQARSQRERSRQREPVAWYSSFTLCARETVNMLSWVK